MTHSTLPTCVAPLDSTRVPAVSVPPGSCDAHCHIFGPFDRYPLPQARSFTPALAPETALRRLHQRLGFAHAVIVQSQGHGFDHQPMLDALVLGKGRYKGVALVRTSDSDAVLARYDAAGVCGARFNFLAHLGGKPDLHAIREVARRVRALGWHLALHLAGHDIVEYASFIRSLEMKVVIDHMARPEPADGAQSAAIDSLVSLMDEGRTWVKLSGADRLSRTGAPFRDALPIARRLADHAPERVLWGSDWPHVNLNGPMPDDAELVDFVGEAIPDASRRRMLWLDNPREFFGFDK